MMKIAKTLGCASLVLGAVFSMAVGSVKAADLSEATSPWTGPYIGANIGYGWDAGNVDLSEKSTDPALDDFLQAAVAAGMFPGSLSPDARGILGGGQVGYNWQLSSGWVLGVEADLQASDIEGSSSETRTPFQFDETETGAHKKIDWFGTLRARAGYLVNPQLLLYATGGLAYGETSLKFETTDVPAGCIPDATICSDDTSSGVKVGWTAGAGAEMMLTPNWSVKAEYLYLDLGERSFEAESNTPIVFDASAVYHEQVVHLGVNFHFN